MYALEFGQGMIAAYGGATSDGDLQPRRDVSLSLELAKQLVDFFESRPVLIGKKLRRQIDHDQQRLAVGTHEQGAGARRIGCADARDDGALLRRLRRLGRFFFVGKKRFVGSLDFVGQAAVGLGDLVDSRLQSSLMNFRSPARCGLSSSFGSRTRTTLLPGPSWGKA